jgi:hypothetical protein
MVKYGPILKKFLLKCQANTRHTRTIVNFLVKRPRARIKNVCLRLAFKKNLPNEPVSFFKNLPHAARNR